MSWPSFLERQLRVRTNAYQISLFDTRDGHLDFHRRARFASTRTLLLTRSFGDASGAIANGAPGSACTSTLADGASCSSSCTPATPIGTKVVQPHLTDIGQQRQLVRSRPAPSPTALRLCLLIDPCGWRKHARQRNTGYTLSGQRSCSDGTLTNTAVCNGNSRRRIWRHCQRRLERLHLHPCTWIIMHASLQHWLYVFGNEVMQCWHSSPTPLCAMATIALPPSTIQTKRRWRRCFLLHQWGHCQRHNWVMLVLGMQRWDTVEQVAKLQAHVAPRRTRARMEATVLSTA